MISEAEQRDIEQPEESNETEDQRVYRWRLEQLTRAGYSRGIAALVARAAEIDLHVACRLVTSGCPEATAYMILA